MITQVIVRATSYFAGLTPTDANISVRIGGSTTGQIVNNKTLTWGTGGAADQANYLTPENGAGTPKICVDSPSSSSSALIINSLLYGLLIAALS